jgi:hypothetical protein
VIPDGQEFKHCKESQEDYCHNCWYVNPDETEKYLERSIVEGMKGGELG